MKSSSRPEHGWRFRERRTFASTGCCAGASVIDCWWPNRNSLTWYSLRLNSRPSVLRSSGSMNHDESQLSIQAMLTVWESRCRKYHPPRVLQNQRGEAPFVGLAPQRRRMVHFNVTTHPTAEWASQQLLEAFPFDTAPKYLLRDRDRLYGDQFRRPIRDIGIQEVLGAPRSPWQRAYVERLIGSIRRECLDHVFVFGEHALRRVLHSTIRYYHKSRLHLSLEKDSPDPHTVQSVGKIIATPEVGGLHHRYERRAA